MAGLAKTLGNGTMTNDLAEFATHSEVLLLIGTNTSECHPIIAMQMLRGVERGAKLIVIDPKRTDMAKKADIFLQIPAGYNIPILNAMVNHIIQNDLYDKEFVKNHTHGFEYVKEVVKDFSPKRVEAETGISADLVIKAAEIYAKSSASAICYTMGVTQFSDGTSNVFALSNLALITGNIGKKGAGINPLRGQNNVQGSCDMGALPDITPAGRVDDIKTREKLKEIWGFEINPNPGFKLTKVPELIEKEIIKCLYVFGENPVMSDPWTAHFIEAINSLELLIVQDLFLTETAQKADIVLPASGWGEKDGTFINTSRRVQRTRMAVLPKNGVPHDWQIVCEIAKKMGLKGFEFRNSEEIWNEVRLTNPKFYGGISYRRLEILGGISWPCPDESHPGTPCLYEDKNSMLEDGKFRLVPVIYSKHLNKQDAQKELRQKLKIPDEYPVGCGALSEIPDELYPCIFTTGRKVYHYHTGTMTRECAPLEHGADTSSAAIEVSSDIAKSRGLYNGCYAVVKNKRGQLAARVLINPDLKDSTIFTTFHYGEAGGNEITNTTDKDPLSGIVPLKMTIANIKKIDEREFLILREKNEMDMHSEIPYKSIRRNL